MRLVVLSFFCLILVPTALAAVAQSQKTALPGFRTPSGNIRCYLLPQTAASPALLRCQIAEASYAKQLESRCLGPNKRGVDWHGFELSAHGRGGVTCSGGILYDPTTMVPRYALLGYGQRWHHGPFGCTVRLSGVTCKAQSGHGLLIARSFWRAW